MAGLYIVFEGGEGCGKSTVINRLSEFLKEKGYSTFVTKEPGGTDFGKKVREILLYKHDFDLITELDDLRKAYSGKISERTTEFLRKAAYWYVKYGTTMTHHQILADNEKWSKIRACLFNADRSHLVDIINGKKKAGTIILSDRNKTSTEVYQGIVGNGNREKIISDIHEATGGLEADLEMIYDIEPELGLKRAGKATAAEGKKDVVEALGVDYHRKVNAAYRQIFHEYKERGINVDIIDVNKLDEAQEFEETLRIVLPFIEKNYKK